MTPIAESLDRLTARDEYLRPMLRTARDDQPGWVSAAEMMQPDSPHLADILARVAAHYGATDRRSPAALWFGHHAYIMMAFPMASYYLDRRVPHMTFTDLWLRFDEHGEVCAQAWEGRAFSALASDPAAGDPGCEVVETREELQASLREQVLNYFEATVPAVRARCTFGTPGLWALVADYFANTFAWAAGLVGPECVGVAEVRLVAAPSPRLRRKRDFIVVEHAGLTWNLIDRLSCCLYYTLKPGEYCLSCPLRSRESKVATIEARLARMAAGEDPYTGQED
jgi:hypothetical protein